MPANNYSYERVDWLYPLQEAALFPNEHNVVCEASTKSGKTLGAIARIIERALINGRNGRNFWWVAPVYSQARIAFTRSKQLIPPYLLTKQPNETRMELKLVNGATIVYKSGERPNNLYGEDVYDAIVDEATRLPEASWLALQSTLTATNGSCCVIGNVTTRRNWAYDLARRAEAGNLLDWHYAKITAADAIAAGVLKQSVVDAKRALFPEAAFNALYYCIPDADGGNPFGHTAIEAGVINSMPKTPPAAWGWDLAKTTDWTVGLALDAAKVQCRLHRWNMNSLPPATPAGETYWTATERMIIQHIGASTPTKIDATGVGGPLAERVAKATGRRISAPGNKHPSDIDYVFTQASKQDMVEDLISAIQNHELSFTRDVAVELAWFEYAVSRTGKLTYAATPGHTDDRVCALGLANIAANSQPNPASIAVQMAAINKAKAAAAAITAAATGARR